MVLLWSHSVLIVTRALLQTRSIRSFSGSSMSAFKTPRLSGYSSRALSPHGRRDLAYALPPELLDTQFFVETKLRGRTKVLVAAVYNMCAV